MEGSNITREELEQRARDGSLVVLDVRPDVEYAAGHIPNAISMPIDELQDRISEIPADADVVAYCRGTYCVMAHEAVALLRRHGRRAFLLDDGLLEWRLAGRPVATAQTPAAG